VEQEFALKRQLFLCEQGYAYGIQVAGSGAATVEAAGSSTEYRGRRPG
jgi:hypothetical protein